MNQPAQEVAGPASEVIAVAERLADVLANGGWLEPRTIEGAPLVAGELAFADLHATGWRYFGLDSVAYERRTVLGGGPFLMVMTLLMSARGNRRRRHQAELAAAPQWRALGPLRIVVTSERLLVWHESVWCSVWFSAVTEVRPHPANLTLDILFEADPPYRLMGPHVLSLAVVLRHAGERSAGGGRTDVR